MQTLFDEPRVFEFFQAVRLLELHNPDRAAVGEISDPNREAARFISRVGFGFPPSDLDDVEPEAPREGGRPNRPPLMTVGFLGIGNPSCFGSLPHPYAEVMEVLGRRRERALRDFLDCFNHRLISLFYRAFKKNNLAVSYERDRKSGIEDVLLASVGLCNRAMRDRTEFDQRAMLSWISVLGRSCSTASGLTSLLEDYMNAPVKVEEFAAAWYEIEPEDRYRLGEGHGRLGQDIVIGSRVRTGEFQFRVRIGPLDRDRYEALLPGGEQHRRVIELIRLAVGSELDFEIQPVLDGEEVPLLVADSKPSRPLGLGWSTWLHTKPGRREGEDVLAEPGPDRDDLVIRITDLADRPMSPQESV